jgi:hypothetical protein
MATARFGIVLLDDAQQGKSVTLNAALNILDAKAAHLDLANTFTNTNTFANLLCNLIAGTSYGGNNVPFNLATTQVTYTTDADKTLVIPATTAAYVDIQQEGGPILTANRSLIVPLGIGNFWVVRNRQTVRTITIIGTSGAGAPIPAGKTAILVGSGANITFASQPITPATGAP